MLSYNFQNIPKRYKKRKKELIDLINSYNPADILRNKFLPGLVFNKPILIIHKPLRKAAKFYKNKIFLDFRNPSKYLWLSICHETAHIFFRLYGWKKSNIYKILGNKYKLSYFSKFETSIFYAVDQTCAILMQAYCENLLKIRPLDWKYWKSTFNYMEVEELGKSLWLEWLKMVKQGKNLSIFKWLEKMEKKNLFN